ncbi:MAG: efflux RND transporter periplasmic adaptor subunit [Candidatus Omnitrophica bacterium]|nr:efflux RND transporter periplasmic adaptor subunit [Candidatus Omnitrophota bacterium]
MATIKGAKIRKTFIIIILLIIAVAVIHHLFFKGSDLFDLVKQQPKSDGADALPQGEQQQAAQAVAIRAFTVAQFDFKDYLNALGTIKGGLEFKLSFEIPGIIDSINYSEGEKYGKGALLLSLKQDDILLRLRRSEARYNKSRANEDIYKQKVKEQEKLFQIGAIPHSTLQKAKYELQGAQYEREETGLAVRADEVILEKSNIYGPSAGMIGELNVEVGEAVTSNTLLGTHLLIEYVQAEFGVIERDVSRIEVKQEAFVYVDAYPEKTFNGIVDSISPIVTGVSRTASAEIKIDNKEGLLLPGMFARIKILLYEKDNAVVIPTEAIVEHQGKQLVYVVNEKDRSVGMRSVNVEYTQSDYSIITEGLKKDELIAISSLDKLTSGAKVEILEKQQI